MTGVITTIATMGVLNIIIAFIGLKNSKFRRVVQDEPLVLIQNGKILENMLRRTRFNLDELLAELRLKNVPDINDVEFTILESNGQISVIPKSQARYVRPDDLKVNTEYEGMSTVLIEDGNIVEDNLRENQLDEEWLHKELQEWDLNRKIFLLLFWILRDGCLLVERGREVQSKKPAPPSQT